MSLKFALSTVAVIASLGASGPVYVPPELATIAATYGIRPSLTDPGGMQTATGDAGISPAALFDTFSTARSAPANTYYQDPSRPDDSGNGLTLATAKRTLPAAIALGNASGQPYMLSVEGVENFRATGPAGTDFTQDVAIVARTGRALFGVHDNFTPPTADATYTTVYVGSLSNVDRVCNRLSQNVDGNNTDYEYYSPAAGQYGSVANALAAMHATSGKDMITVDTGAGKYYLKRADGAQPTPTNTRLYRSAVSLFKNRNNVNIYMKNVDMEGNSPLDVDRTIVQTNARAVVLDTCSGKYAGGIVNPGSRGLSVSNFKGIAYFYNCIAMGNATDGMNGHDPLSSGLTLLFVNPIANDNGRHFDLSGSTSQSCNGITAHDDCNLIVLGGTSLRNHGGSFRPIDHVVFLVAGLRANDLGDVVFGGTLTPRAFMNDGLTIGYYDRCKADVATGEIAFFVGTGSVQHMRQTHTTPGSYGGGGTRDTYA